MMAEGDASGGTRLNPAGQVVSQNHRITESQNGRDWKGPLWVI